MSDWPIPTPQPQPPAPPRRHRRRGIIAAAAIAVAVSAGAYGVAHAWEAHHRWSMRDGIPVQLIEHRIDSALRKADATDDQVGRVNTIIEAAARDIEPLRAEMAGTRAQAVSLLTAPQIDRAAIDHLRTERAGTMDRISQRVTTALADAAEVLTPAQREKLAHVVADMHDHQPD